MVLNEQRRVRFGQLVLAAGFVLPIAQGSSADTRSIDGTGNNVANPDWGSINIQLRRLTSVNYDDGISAPAGADRPNPRAISNAICAQDELIFNPVNASNLIWQWGQFLDHDLDLTDAGHPPEAFHIEVPMGDPVFDPESTGQAIIPLLRSIFDPTTGDSVGNPRQQINQITGFIDASNVYGSEESRAIALRTMDGTGRLKTSEGNLLPFNVDGLPNLGGPDPSLFVAGDIRANEQVGLATMHTLFVREHNRIADEMAAFLCDPSDRNPPAWCMSGDEVYEYARARVSALMQVITYNEFLPILLGEDALDPYTGYDTSVDPSIAHIFSAACYRVGHTLLAPQIARLDENLDEIPEGNLALADAFFASWRLIDEGGIGPVLRGLASERAQNVDSKIIDDVRNFLFLAPDPSGLDLPALNLQRGRDHGLPGYNQARVEMGLEAAQGFEDLSSDPDVQAAFASIYDSVDDVDVWVGAVSEDHVDGAIVGELIFTVLKDQFERLRDGDRFYYENVFNGWQLNQLENTTLADVIRRNTEVGDEIQDNVFIVPSECEGDVNDDGIVNGVDLILVILAWGSDDSSADVNGNGLVEIQDLLAVIFNWGVC